MLKVLDVKLDKNSINKALMESKELQQKGWIWCEKYTNEKLEQKKNELISNFQNHPITQEIAAGAAATNFTGTLGGYGNLYGFIGFKAGDNPVDRAIQGFRNVITYNRIGFFNFVWELGITLPSRSNMKPYTKMEWMNKSWIFEIEKGIPDLARYMAKDHPSSRSGGGFQADRAIRKSQMVKSEYISEMIKIFKDIK